MDIEKIRAGGELLQELDKIHMAIFQANRWLEIKDDLEPLDFTNLLSDIRLESVLSHDEYCRLVTHITEILDDKIRIITSNIADI